MKWIHGFAPWFIFCAAGFMAMAQDTGPAGEIGVNYAYNQLDLSDSTVSHQNGGSVYGEYYFHPAHSAFLHATSELGIVGEFSGSGAGSARFYSYLFGPRFNYEWRKTHLGAWGEFEIGAERTTINGTAIYNKSNFSFGVADGLDFIASRHYVVHLFQIEFASASIRSTHQDDMRLSAGIGFRFGEK